MKDVVDAEPPFRLFAGHHLRQGDDVHNHGDHGGGGGVSDELGDNDHGGGVVSGELGDNAGKNLESLLWS